MIINGRHLTKAQKEAARAMAGYLRRCCYYSGTDEEVCEAYFRMNEKMIDKHRTAYDLYMEIVFLRFFLFTGRINGLKVQVIIMTPSYPSVRSDAEDYVVSELGLKVERVQGIPYWEYVCEYEMQEVSCIYLKKEHQKSREE